MPTHNIDLTDHFADFVSAEIEAGHYRDASEVMHAGLRLLEDQTQEQQKKLATLEALAEEALRQVKCGQVVRLKDAQELTDYMNDLERRHGEQPSSRSRTA